MGLCPPAVSLVLLLAAALAQGSAAPAAPPAAAPSRAASARALPQAPAPARARRASSSAGAPSPAAANSSAEPLLGACYRQRNDSVYNYPLNEHAKDCDFQPNTNCDACYLWRQMDGHTTKGQVCFETGSDRNHLKYLPTVPCAGVEEWKKAVRTPGDPEGIWDCAWGSIKAPLSQKTVALGLNPSKHRSEHQMHIHAAELNGSVVFALANALDKGTITDKSFAELPKATPKIPGKATVRAILRAGDATSASPFAKSVHPFATVYANGVRDPHSTGVLVTRHNETHFYVLAVEGGPVECLLYRAPGEWTCPYPPLPKSAKSS